MSLTQREKNCSTFDNIVSVLYTPITWSLVAEKLGVSIKSAACQSGGRIQRPNSSQAKKGILSITGEIKVGTNTEYCVGNIDFDVTPNTCVVGNLTLGVPAKVKVSLSQGRKPVALSVVIIAECYKH